MDLQTELVKAMATTAGFSSPSDIRRNEHYRNVLGIANEWDIVPVVLRSLQTYRNHALLLLLHDLTGAFKPLFVKQGYAVETTMYINAWLEWGEQMYPDFMEIEL